MPPIQSKTWIIVWNNYPPHFWEQLEALVPETVQWIGGCLEEAPTTGTPHFQGVVYLLKKTTLTGTIELFKELTPRVHVGDAHGHPCRGSFAENIKYATKTGVQLLEAGTRPPGGETTSKRKSDAARLEYIKTHSFADCEQEYPSEAFLHRDKILRICRVERPSSLPSYCGIYIYGPPGVGKTTHALTKYPNVYILNKKRLDVWNNYEPGSPILLDEVPFNFFRMNIEIMKDYAGPHPFRVDSKYDPQILVRPSAFIVTSNHSFETQLEHMNVDDRAALIVRYKVYKMNPDRTLTLQQTLHSPP